MHAISSYRGNRPTNTQILKQTHRQDRLQYTAPQLARSVTTARLTIKVVAHYVIRFVVSPALVDAALQLGGHVTCPIPNGDSI